MESLQQNGRIANLTNTVLLFDRFVSKKTLCLNRIRCRWFLQQHMLARLQGFQCPFKMQTVWQWDIDRVNGGIVYESLIGCVDRGDVPFPGVSAGFDLVPCRNGRNDDFRVGLGRLDDSRRSGRW